MNSETNKPDNADYKSDIIVAISKFAEGFDASNQQDIDMLCDMITLLKDNKETDARVWEPINVLVKSIGLEPIQLPTEHNNQEGSLKHECSREPGKNDNVKPIGDTGEVVVYKNENIVTIDEKTKAITIPQVRTKYAEAWVTPNEYRQVKWEEAIKARYRNGSDHYAPQSVEIDKTYASFNYQSINAATKSVISYRLLCPKSHEYNYMVIDN